MRPTGSSICNLHWLILQFAIPAVYPASALVPIASIASVAVSIAVTLAASAFPTLAILTGGALLGLSLWLLRLLGLGAVHRATQRLGKGLSNGVCADISAKLNHSD